MDVYIDVVFIDVYIDVVFIDVVFIDVIIEVAYGKVVYIDVVYTTNVVSIERDVWMAEIIRFSDSRPSKEVVVGDAVRAVVEYRGFSSVIASVAPVAIVRSVGFVTSVA